MNPYKNLSKRQYWTQFASTFDSDGYINEIWQPKFVISSRDKIVTFGSCFAQHFSRALKRANFTWLCVENLPDEVNDEVANSLNYRVFSCRTGNIYTTSMLNQWVSWAVNKQLMPTEVWKYKGRYYDPMRPAIEKEGFESLEECFLMREQARLCFARCIAEADVFVFTLGLTEAWVNQELGYEYPICPQALKAGPVECKSQFVNHNYESVKANLLEALANMRQLNPSIKILLTVSPVPLIATQLSEHVMVATTSAKSILRAVCSEVAENSNYICYFPSYEIITNPFIQNDFFSKDRRSVTNEGVEVVMQHFFSVFVGAEFERGIDSTEKLTMVKEIFHDQIVCEEELLVAFNNGQRT